jgi:hypothetical protein
LGRLELKIDISDIVFGSTANNLSISELFGVHNPQPQNWLGQDIIGIVLDSN